MLVLLCGCGMGWNMLQSDGAKTRWRDGTGDGVGWGGMEPSKISKVSCLE